MAPIRKNIFGMSSFYTNDNNINGVSEEAKEFIKKEFSDSDIVFLKEFMEPDGFDAEGPTSEIWKLYVFVKKNEIVEKYCYTYYYNYKNGCKREYNTEDIFGLAEEKDLINRIKYFDQYNEFEKYEHDEQINGFDEEPEFSNMLEEHITIKAKEVKETLSGECVFVHENYSWGDCDEYGPTEHMWTLYVVMKDADTYKYYKFYREVFETHGQKNEEIDYEEEELWEEEKKRMPVF